MGDQLYVLGGIGAMGSGSQQNLDNGESAGLNPDGTLGPFSLVNGLHLSAARYGARALAIGDHLLLVGGNNAAGYTADIDSALLR